jgi:hypothetical protein
MPLFQTPNLLGLIFQKEQFPEDGGGIGGLMEGLAPALGGGMGGGGMGSIGKSTFAPGTEMSKMKGAAPSSASSKPSPWSSWYNKDSGGGSGGGSSGGGAPPPPDTSMPSAAPTPQLQDPMMGDSQRQMLQMAMSMIR